MISRNRERPTSNVFTQCDVAYWLPAQPIDATLVVNIRERGRVLMSENVAQASLRPEKWGALPSLAAGDLESD